LWPVAESETKSNARRHASGSDGTPTRNNETRRTSSASSISTGLLVLTWVTNPLYGMSKRSLGLLRGPTPNSGSRRSPQVSDTLAVISGRRARRPPAAGCFASTTRRHRLRCIHGGVVALHVINRTHCSGSLIRRTRLRASCPMDRGSYCPHHRRNPRAYAKPELIGCSLNRPRSDRPQLRFATRIDARPTPRRVS
jgi:hypothetical protein